MKKISFASKSLVLLLSICAASGADKEKPFKPAPIDSYGSRTSQEKLTIAAEPYEKEEETRQAFDKLDPNRYGVLPVLVVVRNDGSETFSLEGMRVSYISATRQRIESTPPREVAYVDTPDQPKVYRAPLPLPRTGPKKSALSAWAIEGRAFAARMLPPGETASGFFYFLAPHRAGASLYITGIREASSRRELFYFEIPLKP
jgi:hypothetical protein